MNTAASYARALNELVIKSPQQSLSYLKNLREALGRRGHIKLLPRIFSEYRKLEEGRKREKDHHKITPEAERTRVLLQLYRKLIETK